MFIDQKPAPRVARTKLERINALKLGCAMHLSKDGFWPFLEVILDGTQPFRADTKWKDYLAYCSRFYFAADPETLAAIRSEVEGEYPDIGYLTLNDWGRNQSVPRCRRATRSKTHVRAFFRSRLSDAADSIQLLVYSRLLPGTAQGRQEAH